MFRLVMLLVLVVLALGYAGEMEYQDALAREREQVDPVYRGVLDSAVVAVTR